jgi:CheY-like chemotaxis protein
MVVVEDNPQDVELLRTALVELQLPVTVFIAENAVQAFGLMRLMPEPPAVVVLDLNLPLIKGQAVLREIRGDRRWALVPVVILTSSQVGAEAEECLRLGATAYVVKPPLYEGYLDVARRLGAYIP